MLTEQRGRGNIAYMRTTLDIHDELLRRAERHARRTGRPLRALVEEGLRRVLHPDAPRAPYRLPDLSAGRAGAHDPLAALSWPDLRGLAYRSGAVRLPRTTPPSLAE